MKISPSSPLPTPLVSPPVGAKIRTSAIAATATAATSTAAVAPAAVKASAINNSKINKETAPPVAYERDKAAVVEETETEAKPKTVAAAPSAENLVQKNKYPNEIERLGQLLKLTQAVGQSPVAHNPRAGIFFISGFDYFGLSSSESDGLKQLAQGMPQSQHFRWNEKDQILQKISRENYSPLILVGHSLGGDLAVELANELNSAENAFKEVDLLVTLDAFGRDNDIIPPNVKVNLNYVGEESLWLNDEAHLARNGQRTQVINELRPEEHTELDNTSEVQMSIVRTIEELLKKNKPGLQSA